MSRPPSRTPTPTSSNNGTSTDSDPIIASYDIYLTDSDISRYVLQYLDRPTGHAYDDNNGQKPVAFRQKPKTGLVEVDVPINTRVNYDLGKGLRFGDALRKSRSAREGGAYGMAGGFSVGGGSAGGNGAQGKVKSEEGQGSAQQRGLGSNEGTDASLLKVQTLGGRIKNPEDGDPVYMLAAFRGDKLHLSPVTAVVQLHPQLHHLDAMDEMPKGRGGKGRKEGEEDRPEPEARTIDMKVKSAEDKEVQVAGNLELLKQMQDEQWKTYDWVDAENEESWQIYDNYMMHQDVEELPQLESAINSEDYLDKMSAPRIDPARPEMTGWAMKQNRLKQKGAESSGSSTEEG
ncbi:Sin-like protein conserved region-domain-containing protein [Aspergillus pseudoustus]|uniref:Sin-like protein conserved region-domain-containing protein n=1 Tax=Aspergillus pseudoustus TaxID=1810923 RepID=A0ABR4JTC1_9EURO